MGRLRERTLQELGIGVFDVLVIRVIVGVAVGHVVVAVLRALCHGCSSDCLHCPTREPLT